MSKKYTKKEYRKLKRAGKVKSKKKKNSLIESYYDCPGDCPHQNEDCSSALLGKSLHYLVTTEDLNWPAAGGRSNGKNAAMQEYLDKHRYTVTGAWF